MPQILADALLLFVTVIWGTTFVLVKGAISSVRPFTFLAVRFAIGGISLLLWLFVRKIRVSGRAQANAVIGGMEPVKSHGDTIISADSTVLAKSSGWFVKGAIITGITLLLAYATQTFGLLTVAAGKAAFITGLSVVIVPVASAFLLKTAPNRSTAMGVILAATGLCLMSLTLPFRVEYGDLLVFLCAIFFAAHILLVGTYSRENDPVVFAAIQLIVVAAGSFAAAMLLERPLSVPREAWGAIIYTATVATAVTVLIQSAVQKYTSATHTALIFSAEPVFGAIFAWMMLGEILSPREMAGAVLILSGMLVSEIAPRQRQLENRNSVAAGKDR
jgi:drug/metabolite transporter (DMT)-like permease